MYFFLVYVTKIVFDFAVLKIVLTMLLPVQCRFYIIKAVVSVDIFLKSRDD